MRGELIFALQLLNLGFLLTEYNVTESRWSIARFSLDLSPIKLYD